MNHGMTLHSVRLVMFQSGETWRDNDNSVDPQFSSLTPPNRTRSRRNRIVAHGLRWHTRAPLHESAAEHELKSSSNGSKRAPPLRDPRCVIVTCGGFDMISAPLSRGTWGKFRWYSFPEDMLTAGVLEAGGYGRQWRVVSDKLHGESPTGLGEGSNTMLSETPNAQDIHRSDR